MAFILSSLTNDTKYCFWEKKAENLVVVKKEILIKGGANVADKKTLVTPNGASTEVSDEELALLKENPSFKRHLERGFVKIVETDNKYKAKEESEKLDKKDGSAQLTPEVYKKRGKKAPATKK
jgi:hypothetical protein